MNRAALAAAFAGIMLSGSQAMAADWSDEVIYFIMIDRYADGDGVAHPDIDQANPLAWHGGDLAGIRQHLDDIAGLGATAIWITPVVQQITHSIETEHGPFWGHHGYWTNDFNAIDPHYGTEADLKALVDDAHARGIKVLLDVVYNHVGYGADWTTSRPEWLRQGDECGGDEVTMCLSGLPDLKTELPEVRDYLFDAHIGLAERTGLDGFRLDTFKHVLPAFWDDHRAATRARMGEDFFLLGEVWDADKYIAEPVFAGDRADALFDFSFRDRTLKFMSGVEGADRYARYFTKRADVAAGHYLAPFLSNHDMPMFYAMIRGDRARLEGALTLLMFAEGPPVLSWGEELGRRGGPWPDNREDMPWADGDQDLAAMVRALIALRHAEPDMRAGAVETLAAAGPELVLRRGHIVMAVNREGPLGAITLPDGNWHQVFAAPAGRAAIWRQSGG